MPPRDADALRDALRRIDGRGYKAYKSIAGTYRFPDGIELHIDHVQGDPFAAPSRLRVSVPERVAAFPDWTRRTPSRRTALGDFLTRAFAREIVRQARPVRGSGKSGVIDIEQPAQEVLARSSVAIFGGDHEEEVLYRIGPFERQ